MALKLFRSTGYSSILTPGETRQAMHPGWLVAAISLWVGFACNVALWRELGASHSDLGGLLRALLLGAFTASACAVVLSMLGWRKTLKPAGTLILLAAALAACTVWIQSLPVDAALLDKGLISLVLPTWSNLLHWQVSSLLVGLALVPAGWVWQSRVRRLSGPKQLNANLTGALMAAAPLAGSGFLLLRGIV